MWLGIDPLWEKNIGASPYNYCHGNPINMIDPDGRDDYYDENCNYLGRFGEKNDKIFITSKTLWESAYNQAKSQAKDENRKYDKKYINNIQQKIVNESKMTRQFQYNLKEVNSVIFEGTKFTSSKTNTVDAVKELSDMLGKECSVGVILNVLSATIEYTDIIVGENEHAPLHPELSRGCLFIGNIHGHPSCGDSNRSDSYNTIIGDSQDDKDASRIMKCTVFNIERNIVSKYYYGRNREDYRCDRSAYSIFRKVLNDRK